jgi:very-short-patch-repair endonuclease
MWPLWYTNVDFSDLRPADLGGCAGLDERRLGDLPQVSPVWFERAAARMLAGRGLRRGDFPRETEIQQLALAISRCGLVLVLAVADRTPAQGALRGLAHGAEWLARRGRIAVAVLLSAGLAGSAELATIDADPVVLASAMPALDRAVIVDADQDGVWLGPIIGRPHPNSPSEHKLAMALRLDEELRALFSFNQTVETIYRSYPIIDLLWADGRVAIEIDGSSHWHASQYVADRQRDYELIVSGYTVLRLADQEIMIDTQRVVEKIRKVVEHRRNTNRETRRT